LPQNRLDEYGSPATNLVASDFEVFTFGVKGGFKKLRDIDFAHL
jgi:hypothetical protein